MGNSTYTIDNRSSEKLLKFTNAPVISVDHTGTAIINSGLDFEENIRFTGDNGGTLVVNGPHQQGLALGLPTTTGGITKEGNSTWS